MLWIEFGEVLTAKMIGFEGHQIIYNGNGKTVGEIEIGVNEEVMFSVDSEFDLQNIINVSKKLEKMARIMLRINPDIDP